MPSGDRKSQGVRAERLLRVIAEVQESFVAGAAPEESFSELLHALLQLTGSEYGFIDEVLEQEDGRLVKRNLALSNIAWDQASRALYERLRANQMQLPNLDNLAAAPLRTGAVVIANDAPNDPRRGGLPNGHPLIHCFLGLPLRFAGRLVGVAGVANREGGYDETEAEFLEPLCSTCGALIEAWRLEHHRRETDRRLRAELTRNETLVREAHHRVKNNLQVITSLIRLQMRQSDHEKVVDALRDCEARVRAVALVHDDLAHRNERSVMDLGAYLDRLVRSLKQVYGSELLLRTELSASGASLEESKALPLGLVVSELLANAYKHAVPRGASGVLLKAVVAEDEAIVTVADDGPGMAPGESWLGADSLGLPIVQELVGRQLEGSLEVRAEDGLEVTIRFHTVGASDVQDSAAGSAVP